MLKLMAHGLIIKGEILIDPAPCSNMILKLLPLSTTTVTNILQSVTQVSLFLAQAVYAT